MKTQIVHLESHDDLISIRDKMAWAKTPRILLVWPRSGHVDVRPLDLQLLRRHAASLGAELGIVTRDGEIRAAASEMKLAVFPSTGEAQRRSWPRDVPVRPARRFARRNLRALRARLPDPELFDTSGQPGTRLAIFAAGVLAMLVVVLMFIPSAEIRLDAPTREQQVEISISAETDAARVSLSGVVPARELTFELEESDSMLSSGETVSPDKTAHGRVQFSGLIDTPVEIPAGTVVLTRGDPPVRFATDTPVKVPAEGGEPVEVAVRALSPGSSGNVPAETILAFEGPLGLSVTVTNLVPTVGGTDLITASPTDADRQALRERLLAKIKEHARSQLSSQVQGGDVLFPSTLALLEVLDEAYTPGPDQPGGTLNLTLRAKFRAHYAAAADLNQLAGRVLDASLPAGYVPVDGTLAVQPVSALFGGDDGNTRWQAQGSRTLQARIDPAQVVYLVQGKTAWHAGSVLQETFGLESAPQISIQPFFWPWLPVLPFRIAVAG